MVDCSLRGGESVNIKLLVMDVDGTLTDGKIYMGDNGEIMKAFNIKDGCGIHDILIPFGITPIIISGRSSEILMNRCSELGINNLYQGVSNKSKKLDEVLSLKGSDIKYSNVAYIGDDINDLPVMLLVKHAGGLVGCPADAAKKVMDIADFISSKNGGNGAVREFIDWLLEDDL